MYSTVQKSKRKGCLFGWIILLVLLCLNASRLFPGQKLAKYFLQGRNSGNGEKSSGLGLFLDKRLTEDGSLPLREISGQDSTGHSSKFIFINSYMRSGSTFLGQVFGFRSDVFYYYEPLHRVLGLMYTKGSKLCDLRMPLCEYSYDALGNSLKFLSDVFNCRLQNHSEKMNIKLIKSLSGPKWNSFHECVAQRSEVEGCLVKAEEQCLPTEYRVVKVLRMSLADAASLLQKHPNLVIVHLFRDPRGTFNSHIKTKLFPMLMENTATFVNDTKSICERIREDLVTGLTLRTKFPHRVKLVQYEDLYGNVEKAKLLYKWLGIDLLQESDAFLRTLFRGKDEKKEKSSYLSGPFKYRRSLSFKYLQIIDDECKEAIKMLGLKLYKTEADLHDEGLNPIENGTLPFEL